MFYTHECVVVRIFDGEEIKTKVIDIKKLCNFVVNNVFIWKHLSKKNYVWFLKFKILIFQKNSVGEMPETKVLDHEKFYSW